MPFFSEHLIYRHGATEILLRDPVILVTTAQTIPRVYSANQTAYENLNIQNFVADLITAAGNEHLTTLRNYEPADTDINNDIDEFNCPITLHPILNPVVANDGRTYERAALEQWLNSPDNPNHRTPFSREAVPCNANGVYLLPRNVVLAELIDEHAQRLQQQGNFYERGLNLEPDQWQAFLERAKFRFEVAAATGFAVTLGLLYFLNYQTDADLQSLLNGTKLVIATAAGTTAGTTSYALAVATNAHDATVIGLRALTTNSTTIFNNNGSQRTATNSLLTPQN